MCGILSITNYCLRVLWRAEVSKTCTLFPRCGEPLVTQIRDWPKDRREQLVNFSFRKTIQQDSATKTARDWLQSYERSPTYTSKILATTSSVKSWMPLFGTAYITIGQQTQKTTWRTSPIKRNRSSPSKTVPETLQLAITQAPIRQSRTHVNRGIATVWRQT